MLYQNIVSLCNERQISIARLERDLGFGNATIRTWRTSSPSVDRVLLVANYFGVSVDSLVSVSSDIPAVQGASAS